MSYGVDAKTSQLMSALHYKDHATRMDVVDVGADVANSGVLARCAHALKSREFDMMGRLHANIFFQDHSKTSTRSV